MEPPAKRLRILQSVEVDETNPDYVNAKQKQQQKFKGRLESIFAKYEHMHESMSDEIDMRENQVVVDRGHLRRLVRQVNRRETVLLDNLGLEAGGEPEVAAESEGEDEDSEDELAPTQHPISTSAQKRKRPHQQGAPSDPTQPSPPNNEQPEIPLQHPPAVQSGVQTIPTTPNPAANLLQFVQFPRTPAGQQAQTSFYATLAQTINQAVQQAVAPLFSSILPNTPNVHLPTSNPFTVPETPTLSNDKIAPAKDPKWFFPPLSVETRDLSKPQSSIVAAPVQVPSRKGEARRGTQEETTEAGADRFEPTFSATAIIQSEKTATVTSRNTARRTSPRVEVKRKSWCRVKKYHFTEEDDIYITTQRVLECKQWQEIKDSREKWRDWPLRALQQHWSKRLMGKSLHLKHTPSVQPALKNNQVSEDEIAESPLHHLPTPSSLSHEDSYEQVADATPNPVAHIASSSAQFDDDERDLLSLAGDEVELPAGIEEEETFFPGLEDVILPSVEFNDSVNEDALQQGLLEGSPIVDLAGDLRHITTTEFKTEVVLSSPTSKRQRTRPSKSNQAVPDSDAEDDIDENPTSPTPPTTHTLTRPICNTSFKTLKTLQRHQANPPSKHTHAKPRPRSPSIDLVGDDELQTPASPTPHIKREVSSPPATSFLFSTPARLRPNLPSSDGKSTSRKAYLKQVKQSWAKKGTPTAYKRRSTNAVLGKRVWEGSEDELGM